MVTISQLARMRWSSAPRSDVSMEQLAERYEVLLQRILSMPANGGIAIGVTACARGEGASTVASNLAVSAARTSELRVLLADMNSDDPVLPDRFGIRAQTGFGEVLAGTMPLSEAARPTCFENLALLPAGSLASGRAKFSRLPEALWEMRRQFDLLVFDMPLASEIGAVLTTPLDGVLLVVEAAHLHRDDVRRAKEWLERNEAKLLGVVFNKVAD